MNSMTVNAKDEAGPGSNPSGKLISKENVKWTLGHQMAVLAPLTAKYKPAYVPPLFQKVFDAAKPTLRGENTRVEVETAFKAYVDSLGAAGQNMNLKATVEKVKAKFDRDHPKEYRLAEQKFFYYTQAEAKALKLFKCWNVVTNTVVGCDDFNRGDTGEVVVDPSK